MKTFRIGRILGFPIEINLSFLILLGVIFLWMGGLSGVATVLIAFGAVLLHELGHAVVSRRLGVPIEAIELQFFGGAAKMTRLPDSARDEMLIAAAGPAVSFVLAGVGFGLGALGVPVAALFGTINLVLGVFNLVPALPMDGGRILRAALSTRLGFRRATRAAVVVSRVFSVVFGVVGLVAGQIQLAILAAVLWFMATAEGRAAQALGGYMRSAYPMDPFSGASAEREPEVEIWRRGERAGGTPGREAAWAGPPVRVWVLRDSNGKVRIVWG